MNIRILSGYGYITHYSVMWKGFLVISLFSQTVQTAHPTYLCSFDSYREMSHIFRYLDSKDVNYCEVRNKILLSQEFVQELKESLRKELHCRCDDFEVKFKEFYLSKDIPTTDIKAVTHRFKNSSFNQTTCLFKDSLTRELLDVPMYLWALWLYQSGTAYKGILSVACELRYTKDDFLTLRAHADDLTEVRLVKSVINDLLKTNAGSKSSNAEEIKKAQCNSQVFKWLPGNRFCEGYIECLVKNHRSFWVDGEKKSKSGGKTNFSPDSEMIDSEPSKTKKERQI
ncbi:hypothetical protein RF11_09134 [Thelohanellus kitauei]|uniref:Uncharacterized protein n=1 Tax=Thelohanellus kitauei TaxID=669202 RepID=A0A0C2N1I7_THEKT|nr:hypothetical protein RF11_09134 [Thelohanellus kitauei]